MSNRTEIHSQNKKVIFEVYKYFKKLSNDSTNPEVANFFRQAQKRTAEACCVSVDSVKKITAEGNKLNSDSETSNVDPTFSSTRKTYKKRKYATKIDDFDANIIRNIVDDFNDNKGEYPTLDNILMEFKQKTGYPGSRISLRRLLKSLNIEYKKRNNNKQKDLNDECLRGEIFEPVTILTIPDDSDSDGKHNNND